MVVIGLKDIREHTEHEQMKCTMMVEITQDLGNLCAVLVGDSINMKLLVKILVIPLIVISFCIKGCESADSYYFCIKNNKSIDVIYETKGNNDPETIVSGSEFCYGTISSTPQTPGDLKKTELIKNTAGTILHELKTADEKNAAFVDIGNRTFRWTITD